MKRLCQVGALCALLCACSGVQPQTAAGDCPYPENARPGGCEQYQQMMKLPETPKPGNCMQC
jgi:hypothetical protein